MYLGPYHKTKAVLRTLSVILIILFILFIIKLKTPIPPYPEGGGGPGMGLEVNLGMSNVGEGTDQQEPTLNVPDFEKISVENEEPEKLITQETDESEVIKESTEMKEKKNETIRKKKNQKQVKPKTPKEKKEPVAEINQKAMFPNKKKNSNEGSSASNGDAGAENGTKGSNLYKGGGNGSGGGSGGGSGNGTGTGIGDGYSFSLEGRNITYLQKPEYNYQNEGKVVVEITVDNNGKVISAIPGAKGSTTLDDYLLQVAKKAALMSKFDKKPNSPIQKGTITYIFVLQ